MSIRIKALILAGIFLTFASTVLADTHYINDPVPDPKAQDDTTPSRSNRPEAFAEIGYLLNDSSSFDDAGTHYIVDVRPNVAGGIGVGYNLGPFINLNADINTGPADLKSVDTGVNGNFAFKADNIWITRGMFNVEIYPLKYAITPLVTGGAGFMTTSGSVGNLHLRETDFAYSYGAGVRWDIDAHLFLKLIYRDTLMQYRHFNDHESFKNLFLTVGFAY